MYMVIIVIMSKNNTLGSRIGDGRRALSLTVEQLAERVGVSKQTVSQWETDQTSPRAGLLPTLAEVLGVSIASLFGEGDEEGAA